MNLRSRHKGFTLIELLVVIGILLVLIGMLVLGLKHMGNSGRSSQTRVTLESAKSMLEELKLAKAMPTMTDWTMQMPGNVKKEGADRLSQQITVSRSMFGAMLTVPANKSAFEKLSANVVFNEPGSSPTVVYAIGAPPPAWGLGLDYSAASTTGSFRHCLYPAGGAAYICMQPHTLSTDSNGPGTRTGNWVLQRVGTAANPAPMLKDGWDNPIIFVPPGGLIPPVHAASVPYLNGAVVSNASRTTNYKAKSSVPPVDSLGSPIAVTDTRYWETLGGGVPVQSPDNKPFFASAGPDGDFTTIDDNLYSFQGN